MAEMRNAGGVLIRRRLSFETDFTQIPNAYVRDERLSYKAVGILVHLFSHRHGYELSLKALTTDKDGLAAVRAGVAELEAFGYLRRTNTRTSKGTFVTEWELTEPTIPLLEVPRQTASDNRTRFENRTPTAFENRTNKEHHSRTPIRTTQPHPSTPARAELHPCQHCGRRDAWTAVLPYCDFCGRSNEMAAS